MRWKTRRRVIDLTDHGMIMGILNITPDSFSDGGAYFHVCKAVEHAIGMLQEGAKIIDVGGESTRPGARAVTAAEEIQRVIPVIEAIREASDCLISIDTSKAEVALRAVEAGADIVNDVTGLMGDKEMPRVCAETGVGVVVMHMQGTPETMQQAPEYEEVVRDVRKFFERRYRDLTALGIHPQCLAFDPGIGFGKRHDHNLELLRRLGELEVNGRPIMLGVSRKSVIGKALDIEDAMERDAATVALTAMGRQLGARLHRVHRIRENEEAMRMVEAVLMADGQ